MNKTDAAPQNGHMGYLLTAYLFDSLSAAGRKEVEGHLAGCAQCREQLEALRLTLGAVVTALDKGGKEYVFEARRRVRVLEAAYHSRHSLLGEVPFIGGTNWKLAALAALLMVVVLLGLMVPTLARARAPMQEMLRKGGPTSHSRTFLDTSSDSGFAWGLFGSKKPAAPAPDAKPADKSADYDRRESGLVMITELKPAQPEMKTDDVKTADSKSEAPWRESTERQFAQGNVSRAPATPAPKPSEPPTTQSRTDTITAIAGAADEAFTAGRSTKGLPRPQPRVDTVTGKNAPSATTPARVAGEKPAPAAPAKPNAGLFPTGGATPAPAPEVSSAWVPSDGGTDSGADVSKVVTKERAGEGEATGKFDSRSGGGRKLVVKRGGGIPAKEESAPAETPATAVELPEVLDNKVLPARHDGNIAIAAGTVPFDAEKKTDEGRKEQLRELAGKARQAAEAARQPDLKSLLSKLDDAQDQGKAVATPPPPPPPADAALTDEDIYGRSGEDAGAIAVPARGDLTRDMDGMIRVSDGRAESSERVHVAIAAKDVAIRKQAELVAKERDADLKSATELATLKNEPENEELQREVRRHADDLKKLKGVVLKQQQAVVQEETEKSLEQAREHSIRPPARLKANDGKLNVNSADELLLDNLVSQPDNTPAEPTPGEARDITVPPDVLAKAELGDHFETVNPDRPDTKSAFGNPVTSEYLFSRGKDAGGGGQGGKELDDLFSKVGAAASGGIFSGLLRSRMAANNTAAAASCKAFAEAEEIYHRTDYNADGVLEYAQSLKGKNSLLEKTPGAGDMALVDRSFAAAEGPPSARPTPKAGYCFKVLTGQGPHAPGGARSYLDSAGHMTLGYALVAYPAKYDGTGRDCYIINNNGTTYQADLGPKTHAIVERMTAFDPDPRIWTIEEGGTAPQSTEAAPPQSAAVPAQTKVPRVGALFKPAEDKAIAEAGHLEQLLRGYRYFRADNEKLRLRDFLRRPAPVPPAVLTDEGLDEDLYIERYGTRPFVDCARDHLSTFGLDVDTASYTRARSQLRENKLPEADTVRVEEFLNYFKQPYEVTGDDAFGVFAEGMPAPFCSTGVSPVPMAETAMVRSTGQEARATVELLKIGIKSRDARPDERKPAMLTFVVDTSGSMNRDNRLGLAQAALRALVEDLSPEDAVSIVGFSDQAELALPRTQARQKQRILDAIDSLTPHGATNVEAGLNMGYRLADECYSPDAVNRMILCSDGVANVGAKGPEEMLKLVKVFADRGIDLSAVGFGKGAYNDQMMSRLADNGNGSCYFVDKAEEAQRVFREQLPPHLNVLARDAKAQVEFNPDVVARYRLLGYEKRKIADKDFRNDKIDAGEVAHSTLITVMYEITRKPGSHGPLGKVFLRWKDAGYRHLPVVERNYPLSEGVMAGDVRAASPELRFLACVARFAELLRGSPWVRDGSYAAVLEQLRQLPPDFQEREDWREVCRLVACAQELSVKRWLQEIQ